MLVGRIGKVGQIKFSGGFADTGVTSGGVVYPVVAGRSFQPFLGVGPAGRLADHADQFIIEVEMENRLFRLKLVIDAVPGWKTDLLVRGAAAGEQVCAAPVELVSARVEVIQIFLCSAS